MSILCVPQTRAEEQRHRLGWSFRGLINPKVSFGGMALSSFPPLTVNGEHEYVDGYVRNDSRNNRDGTTWYFGYDNESQCVGGDTRETHRIAYHNYSALAPRESREIFSPGVECTYAYEVLHGKHLALGIETGFGFNSLSTDRTISGSIIEATDLYRHVSWPLPAAPYAGTFDGHGPRIEDSPESQTLASYNQGRATFMNSLDARIFTFRAGPYIELLAGKSFRIKAGAGAVAVFSRSEFTYQDVLFAQGRTVASSSGTSHENHMRIGPYASLGAELALGKSWSLFAEGQYLDLGKINHAIGGRSAGLDLASTLAITGGLRFSF